MPDHGHNRFHVSPGTRVRAGDRDNIGEVLEVHGESAKVRFVSPAGVAATKTLPLDMLSGLSEVEARQLSRRPARPFADVLADQALRLERRAIGLERPIPIGWKRIAEQFGGGFWPGLNVLVGGTGAMKSQLAIFLAIFAATAGVPVVYIGLELDALQLVARVVGYFTGVRWSDLYKGLIPRDELQAQWLRIRNHLKLPLYLEDAPPGAWPAKWLWEVVDQIRSDERFKEKTGTDGKPLQGSAPILIVTDFLQLIGDAMNRTDPRERVGTASYTARQVARERDVSILLISSAARSAYNALAGEELPEHGLAAFRSKKANRVETRIWRPHNLVGLGKESGEIEFSADSVTVAVGLPKQRILLATAKLRAGVPGWWLLEHDGSNLSEASDNVVLEVADAWREKKESKKKSASPAKETPSTPTDTSDTSPIDTSDDDDLT